MAKAMPYPKLFGALKPRLFKSAQFGARKDLRSFAPLGRRGRLPTWFVAVHALADKSVRPTRFVVRVGSFDYAGSVAERPILLRSR
ncbi:MAG: hypothetical protein WAL32_13390 [Terriglobales bacterium]